MYWASCLGAVWWQLWLCGLCLAFLGYPFKYRIRLSVCVHVLWGSGSQPCRYMTKYCEAGTGVSGEVGEWWGVRVCSWWCWVWESGCGELENVTLGTHFRVFVSKPIPGYQSFDELYPLSAPLVTNQRSAVQYGINISVLCANWWRQRCAVRPCAKAHSIVFRYNISLENVHCGCTLSLQAYSSFV